MYVILKEQAAAYTLEEQVVAVIRLADYSIPAGMLESIFTEAGQLLGSDDASSPAVITAPSAEGQMLRARLAQTTKMMWEAVDLSQLVQTAVKTGAYTAVPNDHVLADASGAGADFEIALPASPAAGIKVRTTLVAEHATYKVTIGRNGSLVNGGTSTSGLSLTKKGNSVYFEYTGATLGWATLISVAASGGTYPGQFDRLTRITGGASGARTTLVITPVGETMNINVAGNLRIVPANTSLDVNTAANWIATTYATAANREGKDFKIYAIENGGASAPTIQCDLAATAAPANSRLIGGFHCLCVAVGTISGHILTDYVAGDILPASVWDLKWCPRRRPDGTYHGGMVYSAAANIWVDIYLVSGTGSSTASVNGGTISDTRNWMDFVDDVGAVGKRLLRDREFQLAAAGCNEGTNITGSADPVTTGGHTDTAGRRMLSNIGCEDMAGAIWQWLDEQSYRYDAATWSWKDVTGGKGKLYTQDSYGDVKLLAGGVWGDGVGCGSRGRYAAFYRWAADTGVGGRAGVEPE